MTRAVALAASIRPAGLADLPALLRLLRLLDVGAEPELAPGQAEARFLELVGNPRHAVFVAELDNAVVGTFSLTFIGGLSHGARDSCIVEDVVVAAALQGRGLGRTMLRFAIERCAERGCYKLVLSSHLQRSAAHRFYESLRFEKHGYSFLIPIPIANAAPP